MVPAMLIISWKKRYFVLKPDRCVYYENEAALEGYNPKGYIPLQNADFSVNFKMVRKIFTKNLTRWFSPMHLES
jgi:hypothetical protein